MRYVLPWYEQRPGQLRRAGLYTHVHIDGCFPPLLPHLARLPFDGIPAVLFLDHYPLEALQECAEKLAAWCKTRPAG